jgi:hypothetical protein
VKHNGPGTGDEEWGVDGFKFSYNVVKLYIHYILHLQKCAKLHPNFAEHVASENFSILS